MAVTPRPPLVSRQGGWSGGWSGDCYERGGRHGGGGMLAMAAAALRACYGGTRETIETSGTKANEFAQNGAIKVRLKLGTCHYQLQYPDQSMGKTRTMSTTLLPQPAAKSRVPASTPITSFHPTPTSTVAGTTHSNLYLSGSQWNLVLSGSMDIAGSTWCKAGKMSARRGGIARMACGIESSQHGRGERSKARDGRRSKAHCKGKTGRFCGHEVHRSVRISLRKDGGG